MRAADLKMLRAVERRSGLRRELLRHIELTIWHIRVLTEISPTVGRAALRAVDARLEWEAGMLEELGYPRLAARARASISGIDWTPEGGTPDGGNACPAPMLAGVESRGVVRRWRYYQ